MRIEYICHACLFVDSGDVQIVTDPWFKGSAYCGQWNIFPKPVNTEILDKAQVIALSHGHEDHFHEPSLRGLPRAAKVFYPYSWYGGTTEFLQELGFKDVVEAAAQKTYKLSPDTSLTYVVNSLDSIVVIEAEGIVLVNVNDALHSFPPKIQDLFITAIKERWPKIDTVFCGFGGASYFPNAIHCPGKDDIEIGEAREQLFAHSFCRIVHGLAPEVAVPFAADFALLQPEQRWINDVRFPRARLAEYFRQLYPEAAESVRIVAMYPGDVLANNQLVPNSPYRSQFVEGGLKHLLEEQYRDEIKALTSAPQIGEEDARRLEGEIIANINRRKDLYADQLCSIKFSIKVQDCPISPCFNVSFEDARLQVTRSEHPTPDSLLVVRTSSRILRHSFASDWGGDAITIGYGLDVDVFDPATIQSSLDVACVRLLTRQPSASHYWKQEPLRMARHLISSQTTRAWVTKAVLNPSGDYSDKKTNDLMREWMFRSKCEVCRACDLPLLDDKFAAAL